MIGVIASKEALAIAQERSLELIEVQGSADPPVWKLRTPKPGQQQQPKDAAIPASRLAAAAAMARPEEVEALQRQEALQRKDANKKESDRRKRKPPKPPKEKEVRLTDSIAPRDVETKIQKAIKFLEKGHVVRVLVLNQGKRDPDEPSKAYAVTLVEQVTAELTDYAKISRVQGNTSLREDDATKINRNIIGPVFATLTPIQGAFRNPPTPKSDRKAGRGRGADADEYDDD